MILDRDLVRSKDTLCRIKTVIVTIRLSTRLLEPSKIKLADKPLRLLNPRLFNRYLQ